MACPKNIQPSRVINFIDFSGFPAYFAYQTSLGHVANQSVAGTTSVPNQASDGTNRSGATLNWREFTIPKLWKRVAAEFVDFLILFILKLIVTYIAIDWLGVIAPDRYDKALLLAATTNGDLDLLTSIEVTSDILLLEVIHKILVCFFEAMWTCSGSRREILESKSSLT